MRIPAGIARLAGALQASGIACRLLDAAKGPIIAEVARLRVTRALEGLPHGEELWLVIRRHEDGQIRYAFSNAPADMPFAQMCTAIGMRWAIEQCFQEGKSHLGMGSYEHRSWPAWHRHMIYVFLAQHLVLRLRLRWKKNSGAHLAAGTQDNGDHLASQIMELPRGAADHSLPHPTQSSGLPVALEKTSRCGGSLKVIGYHAL